MESKLPGRRALNLAGFLACAGMMAYALYAEYQLLMEPCPLCVFQRMVVIALGIVFLAAALHNPGGAIGRGVYAGLLLAAAAAGAGVAGRHVWLQSLPAEQVPACGPGFGYIIDSFPLADALRMIFTGSGECATVDWSFLGLSMPAWVLICVVLLGAAGVANNLRAAPVSR
ncbi:MAG: disulfide bond formation protein B [Woeseiaceae bacterium]|nr:disulfide bond formation protein B [Woeseiaceae bacterium]